MTEPIASEFPSFHEFASEWFERHKGEWRENTHLDYAWQLTNHLSPFFVRHWLSQIAVQRSIPHSLRTLGCGSQALA